MSSENTPTSLNLAMAGHWRYAPSALHDLFGKDNHYRLAIRVEIALLHVLGQIGFIPAADIALLTPDLEADLLTITTTQVDQRERKTNHDIRALVQLMQERMPSKLVPYVHFGLTSYDVIETAESLRMRMAHEMVKKMTGQLIRQLANRVHEHAATLQIGRTHLQHALPITVGFWLATILHRLIYNIRQADVFADALVGKISGAVGAYNAQFGFGILEKCGDVSFEVRLLAHLGLKPAPISTQILPPEPMTDYLYSVLKLSAALCQLGNDGRILMASEIGEIKELREAGAAGSSTMAHKDNPITLENTVGMYEKSVGEFMKLMFLFVSDLQRDLTGSSVMRDRVILIINLVSQLSRLLAEKDGKSFIQRLEVNAEACRRNLGLKGSQILAEPMYLILGWVGFSGDAHKLVSDEVVPRTDGGRKSIVEATRAALGDKFPDQADLLDAVPQDMLRLLENPGMYSGRAEQKALQIAAAADAYLAEST